MKKKAAAAKAPAAKATVAAPKSGPLVDSRSQQVQLEAEEGEQVIIDSKMTSQQAEKEAIA